MNIDPGDINALRAPDVLHEYCRGVLGTGKRVGRLMFYPCPFGSHTRPKLEVAEKDGCGVALCRACNRGGTVYDIAGAVNGLDPRKDFAACVQAVADAVGYTLTDTGNGDTPKKGNRRRKSAFSARSGASTLPAMQKPAEKPLEYLPAEEEKQALDNVRRLAACPDMQSRFADMLNLPPWIIQSHTDIEECACRGLLGMDMQGRLQYVYTHCPDDGKPVRVHMVKTRCKEIPWGKNDKFRIPPGQSKSRLWGADDAALASVVILTEGESDALAVRASLECWLDAWTHEEIAINPPRMAVLARPDAGTFHESWARALRGKAVILLTDADDAGQQGADKIADILHAAGVAEVERWQPLNGCKDARTAFDKNNPADLMRDVVARKTSKKNNDEEQEKINR